MHFLISIGIILAIIGIALTGILKWPLKTSDKLLIAILATFVVKFSFDDVSIITANRLYSAIAAVLGVSTIATCGWYIKYLTDTQSRFGFRQLYIYLPLTAYALFFVVFFPGAMPGTRANLYYSGLGLVLLLIIYYFWFCIDMLRRHQQLIRENYSGAPGSITVNWMIIIIALQVGEFLLKVVLTRFISNYDNTDITIVTNEYCFIIMTFLLVVLGIWQKSIPVFIPTSEDISQSVLQAGDLKRYQSKIEKYMDEQKPYLDPELTIEKLSEQMRIKKLLLSQTLNKGFNKNFFTFIKEYRIHHVETELKNKVNEERTIMDIAYMSGFNSKTGFNRAFKEVVGKTPTEYLEN
jgi:AraC-like DNA-binding protein